MSATTLKMEVESFDCRSSVRIICHNSEVIKAEKILVRCRRLENENELGEDTNCVKDINANSGLVISNLTKNCMYEVEIKSELGSPSRCIEFYSGMQLLIGRPDNDLRLCCTMLCYFLLNSILAIVLPKAE
jgi:hypothetical protein